MKERKKTSKENFDSYRSDVFEASQNEILEEFATDSSRANDEQLALFNFGSQFRVENWVDHNGKFVSFFPHVKKNFLILCLSRSRRQ